MVQQIGPVAQQQIAGDGVFSVINAARLHDLLHPEGHQRRQRFRGEGTQNIQLLHADGQRRIQSVHLLKAKCCHLAHSSGGGIHNIIGVSIQLSSCIGAVILVVTKVIDEKTALKSIDLEVVLLFGGSLALAKALDVTGAGNLIADKIVGFLGTNPDPMILLLVIFIVTCTITNFMSNTATTALMVPIAVSLANNVGADPRAVVIATVIAGSCAYATPIGMPANTMVIGLGGYRFKDYVKSGLPLIGFSFVVCMVLLPILFPFYP